MPNTITIQLLRKNFSHDSRRSCTLVSVLTCIFFWIFCIVLIIFSSFAQHKTVYSYLSIKLCLCLDFLECVTKVHCKICLNTLKKLVETCGSAALEQFNLLQWSANKKWSFSPFTQRCQQKYQATQKCRKKRGVTSSGNRNWFLLMWIAPSYMYITTYYTCDCLTVII